MLALDPDAATWPSAVIGSASSLQYMGSNHRSEPINTSLHRRTFRCIKLPARYRCEGPMGSVHSMSGRCRWCFATDLIDPDIHCNPLRILGSDQCDAPQRPGEKCGQQQRTNDHRNSRALFFHGLPVVCERQARIEPALMYY